MRLAHSRPNADSFGSEETVGRSPSLAIRRADWTREPQPRPSALPFSRTARHRVMDDDRRRTYRRTMRRLLAGLLLLVVLPASAAAARAGDWQAHRSSAGFTVSTPATWVDFTRVTPQLLARIRTDPKLQAYVDLLKQ